MGPGTDRFASQWPSAQASLSFKAQSCRTDPPYPELTAEFFVSHDQFCYRSSSRGCRFDLSSLSPPRMKARTQVPHLWLPLTLKSLPSALWHLISLKGREGADGNIKRNCQLPTTDPIRLHPSPHCGRSTTGCSWKDKASRRQGGFQGGNKQQEQMKSWQELLLSGRNSPAIRKDNTRTVPWPGTLLSLQTVRSSVLDETAMTSEAFPACLCLQAPANPEAKSPHMS